jgi:hypothetical protein
MIRFTAGDTPFQVDYFWLPPGHQTTLLIQADAALNDYEYSRTWKDSNGNTGSCEGDEDGPKVKVGG